MPKNKKPVDPDEVPEPNVGDPSGIEFRSSLFPTKDVPKDIRKLAHAMKTAEIERKHQASIENDCRGDLCHAMEEKGIGKFELEVDGMDFIFYNENNVKVKSKRINKDDDQ